MRVICLYNRLHPLTVQAIERHAPQTEFVDTSGSDFAYWEAIAKRWTGEEDLMLIEHDVEIHAQVVPQFTACPEWWCHFPYPYRGGLTAMATGCTRYRAELQRMVSTSDILAEKSYRGKPGHWEYMDVTMANAFARKNLEVCDHAPPVGHRGQYRPCLACLAMGGECLRGYPSASACFHELRAGTVMPQTPEILIPLLPGSMVKNAQMRISSQAAPTWRNPLKRAAVLYREYRRQHPRI